VNHLKKTGGGKKGKLKIEEVCQPRKVHIGKKEREKGKNPIFMAFP